MPVAHLMALAPLDVWGRTLLKGYRGSRGIHPKYWIRLLGIGFTSLVGTMCSTPERVILWIVRLLSRRDPQRLNHPAGVLVIVGYYRSGTTHAHNLIACDPDVVTPRWYQALLGQGFSLSWGITRFLLVPFLGSSRPQDGVGFGPMWPAEDDFALAGWGVCSTLPGRFIFPSRWDTWNKWNTLDACTESERARWRRTIARFAWKVTRAHPNRMLVLKTPSHGAHITELVEIFGEHVRFLHVTRDPSKVIESNIRMHDSLSSHLLEDPLDPTTLRARIVEEYHTIEHATACQAQSLPEGHIAHMTHEDLIADPIGTLQTALNAINLQFNDQHHHAIQRYLGELGTYERAPQHGCDLGEPGSDEATTIERIRSYWGTPRATPPAVPTPVFERAPVRLARGMLGAFGTAIAWALVWIGTIWIIKQIDPGIKPRLDQLVWIGGSLIGLAAMRCAGGGSRAIGLTAAILTLMVFLAVSFPITVINWNFASDGTREQFIHHNTKGAIHGLLALSSIAFALLGMMTAWRHCSDQRPRAPGR